MMQSLPLIKMQVEAIAEATRHSKKMEELKQKEIETVQTQKEIETVQTKKEIETVQTQKEIETVQRDNENK